MREIIATIHILLPLIIGGMIYICFRSTDLLMFSWFDMIGLAENIPQLRERTFYLRGGIPDWVLYSLPDGAWVWSITSFYTFLWHRCSSFESTFWITLGLCLGLGGELGQGLGLVPGTFDIVDLLLIVLSFLVPYFALSSLTPN
jgi:hypothetical protein